MKKKPVIITIVIVAVAAILIGGGGYLYPHLVERTISQVVDNDMTDIVKISLTDRDVGDRVIEVTDKEDIEEIVGLVKDLKAKKEFRQKIPEGGGLWIEMITSNEERISIGCWRMINGTMYKFNESEKEKREEIWDYVVEKYDLRNRPEEMTEDVEE